MIVVLDPAFFSTRTNQPDEERRLLNDLRMLRVFIRDTGAELVLVEDYWTPLWAELARPLSQRFPRLVSELGTLRRAAVRRSLVAYPGPTYVWGFVPLFDRQDLGLDAEWANRMARSVTRLYLSLDQPIVLYTRPVVGRNLLRHQAGHSTIDEVTRWRLYIQPRTAGAIPIPCVTRPRQVEVEWTARYDHRLAGAEEGARYPFCPPPRWWKRSVTAVRTHTGKPAFIDATGCGWARPNIPSGAGYHWDVFLSDGRRASSVGVNQINVTAFGAPLTEGYPGDLHHVPSKKKTAVTDCGWDCA